MKTQILNVIAVSIILMFAQDTKGEVMSGEHLNGVPYKTYRGPIDVASEKIDAAEKVLTCYLEKKGRKEILSFLKGQAGESWDRIGPEYLERPNAGKELVGVRYQKGAISFVLYENQSVLAFVIEEQPNTEQTYYFFMAGEGEALEVTDEVVF